jgi:D-glucosaminate-specific PTS system IIB component
MGKIALVRIDSRMIHGQVITKWIKQTNANRIIVLDDELSQDPFLTKVYAMAAPPGASVSILSNQAFLDRWNKDQFGNNAILLVIMRNVEAARAAFENGFPMENLQVGGLGGGAGRTTVYMNITLDKKDVEDLEVIQEGGVKITFQTIPEDTPATFDSVKTKVTA